MPNFRQNIVLQALDLNSSHSSRSMYALYWAYCAARSAPTTKPTRLHRRTILDQKCWTFLRFMIFCRYHDRKIPPNLRWTSTQNHKRLLSPILIIACPRKDLCRVAEAPYENDLHNPFFLPTGKLHSISHSAIHREEFPKTSNLNLDNTIDDILHVKSRLIVHLNLRCYSN